MDKIKLRHVMRAFAVFFITGVTLSAGVLAQQVSATMVDPGTPTGDANRGKPLYQACAACHSIDENDVGPKHRGVVGRRAGSLPDYGYSKALKRSGLTWDERTLDRWRGKPSALVPGTKMFFKVDDPQACADLIAYLKEQR